MLLERPWEERFEVLVQKLTGEDIKVLLSLLQENTELFIELLEDFESNEVAP